MGFHDDDDMTQIDDFFFIFVRAVGCEDNTWRNHMIFPLSFDVRPKIFFYFEMIF